MTEGPQGGNPVFDEADLMGRLGGERAFAIEVLQGFISDSKASLVRIRQEAARRDWARVRVEAHSIKGAGLIVSARDLTAAAKALEAAALEASPTAVEVRILELQLALEAFWAATASWAEPSTGEKSGT